MNIGEWFKEHSTIIFLVIVGVVAGVAFLKKNPSTAGTTTAGIDTTGLQTDSSGVPIIYRDVGDTFINVAVNPNPTQPVASAPPTGSTEHPIEPTGNTTTGNTTVSTNTNGSGTPSVGLLGPNVAVNFSARTYTSPTVKTSTPLPIPSNDRLVQGSQNRVWYIDNGIQKLLTSGTGPPVTNDGLPVGSPGNTPH